MKKVLILILCAVMMAAVLPGAGGNSAFSSVKAEDEQPEYTSGDYTYVILDDGSAEITGWRGPETELTIPETLNGRQVTAIGDEAFFRCGSLSSVSVPDSVVSIGNTAFYDCDRLSSVSIGNGVREIGANPFWSCEKLTRIVVAPEHPTLATIDGVLFFKPEKRLVCYPCAFDQPEYSVPQGIRVIGNEAFSFCGSLSSVSIPDSVTSVGDLAFYDCYNLSSVSIGNGVREVGANPFAYCERLTKIGVPPDHPTLAMIDGVLFFTPDQRLVCYPCALDPSDYPIPQGIRAIGDHAFYGCDSLSSVSVPDSVTSIGRQAFEGCRSLSSAAIPDSVTSIGDGAFGRCDGLSSVSIPDSVTFIGEHAFYGCRGLSSVSIPGSVTFIGADAFTGCRNLTLTVLRDSYAARYCEENGLRCQYTDPLDWLND